MPEQAACWPQDRGEHRAPAEKLREVITKGISLPVVSCALAMSSPACCGADSQGKSRC